MLKLGENIKKFRFEHDLTQEQLADVLGVSPQAVSRWENGSTYPDIELLPAMAGFFEITLDELMGMADFQDEKQLQQTYDAYSVNASKGLVWENMELMRQALKRFPNNERLRFNLMHNLYKIWDGACDSRGNCLAPEERQAYLQEAISLGERLLAHCTDSYIRNSTTSLLAYMYHDAGDTPRAIQIAEKLPNLWSCRTNLMSHFYEGEERRHHLQWALDDYVTAMLLNIKKLADLNYKNPALTIAQRIDMLQRGIHVFETLFDEGDYLFHNCAMAQFHRYIAAMAVQIKNYDLTLDYLEKAAECAIAYDTLPEKAMHKSLLFDTMEYNVLNTSKNYTFSSCYELLDRMKKNRYDPIRQDERFQAIVEKITPYASA